MGHKKVHETWVPVPPPIDEVKPKKTPEQIEQDSPRAAVGAATIVGLGLAVIGVDSLLSSCQKDPPHSTPQKQPGDMPSQNINMLKGNEIPKVDPYSIEIIPAAPSLDRDSQER